MPVEGFARVKPAGLVTATVDAFTGMLPSSSTSKTVPEIYLPGTAPTASAKVTVTADVDSATGLLWQTGCAGPMVTKSFIDFSQVEAAFPAWQKADIGWQSRARTGSGVAGGLKHTRTAYFYGTGFFPFGRTWGGSFAPTKKCAIVPVTPPPPTPCVSLDPFSPCPTAPPPSATPVPPPTKQPKPSLCAASHPRTASEASGEGP